MRRAATFFIRCNRVIVDFILWSRQIRTNVGWELEPNIFQAPGRLYTPQNYAAYRRIYLFDTRQILLLGVILHVCHSTEAYTSLMYLPEPLTEKNENCKPIAGTFQANRSLNCAAFLSVK